MSRSLLRGALLTLSLSLPLDAAAQAFCELRDPVRVLYGLFPEADAYASVVRTVDEGTRAYVADKTRLSLHRSELGEHTVYLVKRKKELHGVLHVRSEKSRWGLVEVAWALDSELRVLDFGFQRCRSRTREQLTGDDFRAQLRGKGIDELRGLLTANGEALEPNALSVPDDARELAAAVVRSAVKTIAVTETAWGPDIAKAAGAEAPAAPDADSP